MGYIRGIDVAKWNGNINWGKVWMNGYSFAILKITQKYNNLEPMFERNYLEATKAGFKVGGYRYVYATNVAEAKAEAEAMVKILSGRQMPVGIWLDMEDETLAKLGQYRLWEIIATETKILRKAGYAVGIYCNREWYLKILNGKELAAEFPFWIARYPTIDKGVIKESLNPKNLPGCTAWQFSSKGKVSGISGNVDLDVVYV